MAAQIAADEAEIIVTRANLGAERDSLRIPRAELWQVILPADHANSYLVAITPTRAIPLAGFPNPDLYSISRMLGRSGRDLEARARLLAVLADPYSGSHVAFALSPAPRQTIDSSFVRRWREALPRRGHVTQCSKCRAGRMSWWNQSCREMCTILAKDGPRLFIDSFWPLTVQLNRGLGSRQSLFKCRRKWAL
ncbi:MAG: hypothetical protein ACJ79K_05115 [Gemmatimonadaceae bacterium]